MSSTFNVNSSCDFRRATTVSQGRITRWPIRSANTSTSKDLPMARVSAQASPWSPATERPDSAGIITRSGTTARS